jgi:NAD/NADP transhydrogenase beta subunit
MADSTYYVAGAALVGLVLLGINRMSKVATARRGNFLSMLAMALIVAVALVRTGEVGSIPVWACIAATLVVSLIVGARVKMIAMPQAVAILNGLGGLASALAAWVEIGRGGSRFSVISSALAIAVGLVTLSGSLVAAGKLARWFPQRSVRVPLHTPLSLVLVLAIAAFAALANPLWVALASIAFGILFSVRVGGADMPITISLLNSLSGVAAGIAGIAIGDAVLISVGGIVGASGLLLTQIMCRAMNRSLMHILLGSTSARAAEPAPEERPAPEAREGPPLEEIVRAARDVIIAPGYGMALAQAQEHVKALADALAEKGARVRFAIHPVAGRMPGHMNVLLCEAGVPYEQLLEMDEINRDFASCDLAVVVGASDTVNPAANTAEGTPIYGMPILDVQSARHVVILNLDRRPGYAGVPNPLYDRPGAIFLEGDAKETVPRLVKIILA